MSYQSRKIKAEFTARELWAMWRAVTRFYKPPFTHVLKSKLYDLISDDERRKFRELYETPGGSLREES